MVHLRVASALLGVLMVFPCVARADQTEDAEQVARLSLDATRGVVPQPARAADLFRRARTHQATSFEGMLLCEIRVSGEDWDGTDPFGPVRRNLGRPEIDAEFVLPRRDDRVRYRGPDDQNRVVVAVPGVRLQSGDPLRLSVVDRDVFSNDPIGVFEFVYQDSLPIQAELERATVECRGTPNTALARAIDDDLSSVDSEIARLAADFVPDAEVVGFRRDAIDASQAWLALYELARMVGLADARFLERRDDLRQREAAFVGAATRLVDQLAGEATAVAAFGSLAGTGLALRVDGYDCKLGDVLELHPELGLDTPMSCALYATVRNDSRREVTLTATLHIVDELGNTSPLPRVASRDEVSQAITRMRTLRFGPGETRIVLASPTRHGVLLRVGRRRALDWFRIGPPEQDAPVAAPGQAPAVTP